VRQISRRTALMGTLGLACSFAILYPLAIAVMVRTMRLPKGTIASRAVAMSVALSPDGRSVFVGEALYATPKARLGHDARVSEYDVASRKIVRTFQGLKDLSRNVCVTPDGQTLIAGDWRKVVAWNISSGQVRWKIQSDKKKQSEPDNASPICVSPDGRMVVVGNRLINSASGKIIRRVGTSTPDDSGQSKFTSDGKWVGIMDAANSNVRMNTHGPNEDWFKKVYATQRLRFWRTDIGGLALDLPFVRVRAFDISTNGKWAVVTCDYARNGSNLVDGSIVRRVDLTTGVVAWSRQRNLNSPDKDQDAVLNSVAISPNGKYIAAQSTYDRVIVLNARTGEEIRKPFIVPSNEASWAIPGGLSFSRDGRALVSRIGRKILLWNAATLAD